MEGEVHREGGAGEVIVGEGGGGVGGSRGEGARRWEWENVVFRLRVVECSANKIRARSCLQGPHKNIQNRCWESDDEVVVHLRARFASRRCVFFVALDTCGRARGSLARLARNEGPLGHE